MLLFDFIRKSLKERENAKFIKTYIITPLTSLHSPTNLTLSLTPYRTDWGPRTEAGVLRRRVLVRCCFPSMMLANHSLILAVTDGSESFDVCSYPIIDDFAPNTFLPLGVYSTLHRSPRP